MSIHVRVACTPKEIEDALWLRHQVYIVEERRYGGKPLPGERIADSYDRTPQPAHLMFYDGKEPVGTMRLNCEDDSDARLPPETGFDFRSVIPKTSEDLTTGQLRTRIIASGGMLAVRRDWRKHRGVAAALYRQAANVFYKWQVTHIIAMVSGATLSLYPRMGFVALKEEEWHPAIGDYIVPIVAESSDYYRWAFGEAATPPGHTWPEGRDISCRASQGTRIDQRLQDGVVWHQAKEKRMSHASIRTG